MSSSQNILSSLQWHEPLEGLEFGEVFLGGLASTYFARGRFPGYGLCFTDRRLIGIKMRLITRVVEAPILALIIILYAFVLVETFSLTQAGLALILLPVLPPVADWVLRSLTRKLAERIVSRKGHDVTEMLARRRDFELSRNEIGEFLMQSPPRRLSLGLTRGYLKIIPKDHRLKVVEIKLSGWNQSQKLRELVIRFSSREPKLKALEYPPS